MLALFVLADAITERNTRIVLFVLLIIAILLLLVGAIIAIITMYFSWKTRPGKAHSVAQVDTLPGE